MPGPYWRGLRGFEGMVERESRGSRSTEGGRWATSVRAHHPGLAARGKGEFFLTETREKCGRVDLIKWRHHPSKGYRWLLLRSVKSAACLKHGPSIDK